MYAAILLLLSFAAIGVSAINPFSWGVWFTEIVWAFLAIAIMGVTRRKCPYSKLAYTVMFVWVVLQCIGAHYSFEKVPLDWLTGPLGLTRNPFDRIAHTMVGFFALPLMEYVWHNRLVNGKKMVMYTGITSLIALAGVWELFEWVYAEIEGGDLGAAFLGSQGDVWDAQKDILCDSIGAALSAVIWRCRQPADTPADAEHPAASEGK